MTAKTKPKHQDQPLVSHWQPPRGYFWVWGVFLVLGAITAYLNVQYSQRVLPNVYVGSAPVSNLAPQEVRKTVEAQAAQLKVAFQDDSGVATVDATDLGVMVDVDATVEKAMLSRRSRDVLGNLELWQRQSVPLVYTNDAGMLKDYIVKHYPKTYVDPQDAQLEFNDATQQFDVKPGVPGKGFDIKRFESALPDLAANPRLLALPITTVPVQPLISDEAAKKAQKDINQQVATLLEFKQSGKVVYTVQPKQIAQWVHFIPDTTAGTLTPDFDTAKIEQFLRDDVSAKVTTTPIDRKIIKDKATGQESVVQAGRKGYQVNDADKLAGDVINALKKREAFSRELDIVEAPFKTVTITGSGTWIEVDLSQQRLTLWLGDEVVGSWLISSGKAATPTVIGEGRIYKKYPLQTMTGTINGEYYYVPNIKWVSYFEGGEAIHGTYWHSNFGHPMSHGCINMTEDAAKIIYDNAPIGTKVIVHA